MNWVDEINHKCSIFIQVIQFSFEKIWQLRKDFEFLFHQYFAKIENFPKLKKN